MDTTLITRAWVLINYNSMNLGAHYFIYLLLNCRAMKSKLYLFFSIDNEDAENEPSQDETKKNFFLLFETLTL